MRDDDEVPLEDMIAIEQVAEELWRQSLAGAAWPGAGGDLSSGASAWSAGSVGFHRCDGARRKHRWYPAGPSALSLPLGVLRLGAGSRRIGRRELCCLGRGFAERPMVSRWRTG